MQSFTSETKKRKNYKYKEVYAKCIFLYMRKTTKLLKNIKEELNKQRDSPCSQKGRLHNAKMPVLLNLI